MVNYAVRPSPDMNPFIIRLVNVNVINPVGKAGSLSVNNCPADRLCGTRPTFDGQSTYTKRLTWNQRGVYHDCRAGYRIY